MSTEQGLYRKFIVTRADNSPKHDGCEYYVLDWLHDPFALPAALAYAGACEAMLPALAADLRAKVAEFSKCHAAPSPQGPAPTPGPELWASILADRDPAQTASDIELAVDIIDTHPKSATASPALVRDVSNFLRRLRGLAVSLRRGPAPTPRRPAREVAEEAVAGMRADGMLTEEEIDDFRNVAESAVEADRVDRLAPVQGEAPAGLEGAYSKRLAAVAGEVFDLRAQVGGLLGAMEAIRGMCRGLVDTGTHRDTAVEYALRTAEAALATQPPAPPVGTGGMTP